MGRLHFWIFAVALPGLVFFLSADALIGNARSEGYLFNGPFVILSVTMFGSLVGLLVPAFFAGSAAARDIQARMDLLIYTTPITKAAYLRCVSTPLFSCSH